MSNGQNSIRRARRGKQRPAAREHIDALGLRAYGPLTAGARPSDLSMRAPKPSGSSGKVSSSQNAKKSELPHLSSNVELALSQFTFDVSYFQGLEGTWPAPSLLALELVVEWYRKVRSTSLQIPAGRTEKVLFALLHICRTDISLNTVIWLFYALEALLDTNPGENRRTLVARSALILSPTPHQKKYLKKNLHSLYELRSSFVHGGREVAHPMHNEALDKRVEADTRKWPARLSLDLRCSGRACRN